MAFAVGLIWGGWSYWEHARRTKVNPNVQLSPDASYEVELWAHDFPVAWDGKSYSAYLRGAIDAFRAVHPHITVNLRLLSYEDGYDSLLAALEEGDPPDVFGVLPGPAVFDPSLQVPAEFYISNPEVFYPASRESLTEERRLYCYPRWSRSSVLLAREEMLERAGISVAKVRERGWTWDEFLTALREVSTVLPAGAAALVLQPEAVDLFMGLLGSLSSEAIGTNADIGSPFNREGFAQVLTFYQNLWQSRLLPPDLQRARHDMLKRLLENRAAIVGPVGPWAARLQKGTGGKLVMLPLPGQANPVRQVRSAGWALFRRPGRIDNARLKAAAALAEYLAHNFDPLAGVQLGALPAVREIKAFGPEVQAMGREANWMLAAFHARAGLPIGEWEEREENIKRFVLPALDEFWKNPNRKEDVLEWVFPSE